ncbi:CDP-alcohol phosphatidyltransferase family protein [Ectothiorhodospira marina]|uniref:Phosphatidylglycerophosphate synthase n=1 Tax=Ectothiorhodospira marina TaxID=1396821 RepID=A0A1H7QKA8_9GAMM|nr:CDP-alcohol phosphatidyltransferase family protein [Ectothiorhodospira marina]SEL48402.1 Phosphatidylglycerophosphate synthase [Ectothiorhodospira marina]
MGKTVEAMKGWVAQPRWAPLRLLPDLLAGVGLLLAGLAWLVSVGLLTLATAAGSVLAYGVLAVLLLGRWSAPRSGFGWPNRVTLLRALPVCVLAGALAQPELYRDHGTLLAALAGAALLLDGLDGWLARRLDAATAFGARFDMELDAALILVLCLGLALSGKVGAWVLAIGLMRYAFVAAGYRAPRLRRPLPDSTRRKVVCVWQVLALLACLPGFVTAATATWLAASALLALTVSFALDVRWLLR